MTKSELAGHVAARIGANKDDARRMVDLLFAAIADAATRGDKITLRGFGTFKVKEMPARNVRHPRTGEEIKVPKSRKVALSAAKALTQRLNGQP